MNSRLKIVLLGLMIWALRFIGGGVGFFILGAGAGESLSAVLWVSAIESFLVGIGLALALFVVFRVKGQDYKRTAWEAGIAWYAILLLTNLIVLFGLLDQEIEFWFPSILMRFEVLIIPIVVGHLLARTKE